MLGSIVEEEEEKIKHKPVLYSSYQLLMEGKAEVSVSTENNVIVLSELLRDLYEKHYALFAKYHYLKTEFDEYKNQKYLIVPNIFKSSKTLNTSSAGPNNHCVFQYPHSKSRFRINQLESTKLCSM